MNDDYLWDGSGAPDPEVERLENLLGRFRHTGRVPEFPAAVVPMRASSAIRRFAWPMSVAAIALLACATLVTWFSFRRASWAVADLAGTPTIGGQPAKPREQLRIGQSLETDANSRVQLAVHGLGVIDVDPDSRLTLLQATASQQQIRLERGTIRAQIVAPPYVFLVHTPTAYAMDMGCAYTLHVNDDGSSILRVTIGWVDLQHGWVQSLVPAGAAAESRPGTGPGAPYFEDASQQFREALEVLNFNRADAGTRAAALTTLLAEARPRDAFTLLNLFRRVDAPERGPLYDRLAALIPPPAGANRDAAIEGNWRALDPWWDAVGVGHPKKGHASPPLVEE